MNQHRLLKMAQLTSQYLMLVNTSSIIAAKMRRLSKIAAIISRSLETATEIGLIRLHGTVRQQDASKQIHRKQPWKVLANT